MKRLDGNGDETGDSAKYSYGGKELDSGTNLYYFNARYYDATIGRFINVDPVQDGGNWYVYCGNNPLNKVDPTGLEGKTAKLTKTVYDIDVTLGFRICSELQGNAISESAHKEAVSFALNTISCLGVVGSVFNTAKVAKQTADILTTVGNIGTLTAEGVSINSLFVPKNYSEIKDVLDWFDKYCEAEKLGNISNLKFQLTIAETTISYDDLLIDINASLSISYVEKSGKIGFDSIPINNLWRKNIQNIVNSSRITKLNSKQQVGTYKRTNDLEVIIWGTLNFGNIIIPYKYEAIFSDEVVEGESYGKR